MFLFEVNAWKGSMGRVSITSFSNHYQFSS
jgi:hypothetical protein